jgi:hypothetical protein
VLTKPRFMFASEGIWNLLVVKAPVA